MAQTNGAATAPSTSAPASPIPYTHIKVGHPRWNKAVILAIIATVMALSLIAAGRMVSPV